MIIGLFASPLVASAQYYYDYYPYPLYVTTSNATNITTKGATLNGLVNGNISYSTYNLRAWFEYGATPSFGYSTPRGNYNVGYVNLSTNIEGLNPGTVYYFRAVAQNPQGAFVYGNTNSFRTNFSSYANAGDNYNIYNSNTPVSLTAITRPATTVGTRSVDLNAHIINTPGIPASTWFEWGTDYALVNQTPIIAVSALPAVNHLSTITKLAPGTTYYFRAVVINNFTRSNGTILSFTTKNVVAAPQEVAEPKVTEKDTIEEVKKEPSSPLTASAIGGVGFLPTNIFEWTVLAILVAVLIILVRNIYLKK